MDSSYLCDIRITPILEEKQPMLYDVSLSVLSSLLTDEYCDIFPSTLATAADGLLA